MYNLGMLPEVHLFADGSCLRKIGGWAVILRHVATGREHRMAGSARNVNSTIMEMLAVAKALESLPVPCRVTIYSDSQIVVGGINLWRFKWKRHGWTRFNKRLGVQFPVRHTPMWQRLDAAIARHEVQAEWVKGHDGHPENEWCDQTARHKREELQNLVAAGLGVPETVKYPRMLPEVMLFSDGSCPVPHGPGGWACILRLLPGGQEKRLSGGEPATTNNRMELMGVIKGLELLPRKCQVKIVSDSQYVTKGIAEWMPKWKKSGWRKKNYTTREWEEVMNVDLWKRIDALIGQHEITTEWVKGHDGHPENEWCDAAAGAETKRLVVEAKTQKQVSQEKHG